MLACELLKKHPGLIAPAPAQGRFNVPSRREGASTVHPDALRLREWLRMLQAKGLSEGQARHEGLCADCGATVERGSPVVACDRDGLTTHRDCAGFWWKYEPERDPDDIPF
jgi:hypothetical protein